MTETFRRVFGPGKPVIAMVHLGALPGAPLFDEGAASRASSRTPAPTSARSRPRAWTR
jgi:predicted TIM-barrel enzyme